MAFRREGDIGSVRQDPALQGSQPGPSVSFAFETYVEMVHDSSQLPVSQPGVDDGDNAIRMRGRPVRRHVRLVRLPQGVRQSLKADHEETSVRADMVKLRWHSCYHELYIMATTGLVQTVPER